MGSLDRRGTRACSGFTSLGTIALLGVLAATPAWAQDATADSAAPAMAEPAPQETTPAEQGQIIVTGSRIARRDYQSNTPIVTIGSETLAGAGQPTLDRAIGQMPQFAAAQGLAQVGDVQARTGFQGGQAYSDLRGLGPNRSLILVDGRRLIASNPNGSIDLNTIPMAMIENVEVITGGASATYGSDAIAGVVNFKLRRHFNGIELGARRGGTLEGDGANTQFTLLAGSDFADGRGSAIVAFEYAERDRIAGADRPFFRNIRLLARPPEGLVENGLFGSQPTVAAVNALLATYPGTTPISGTGQYNGAIGFNTDGTIFTTSAGSNCVQNYRGLPTAPLGLGITSNCRQVAVALGNYFSIQVPLKKYNVLTKLDYELAGGITAYGTFNFMHSSALDSTSAGSTGPGKYLVVPLNSPWVTGNPALQALLASRPAVPGDPTALTRALSVTKLLTASGPRSQTFEYDVYQGVIGLRGTIPGTALNFDVYGSIGQTHFTNMQYNDTSRANIAAVLNGTANFTGSAGSCIGYAWNPFGNNPFSPGCEQFITRDNTNINTTRQQVIEATVTGPIFKLPGGDLSFALGAAYRNNSFAFRPDNALILGDTPSFDNIVATGGSQKVKEVFGELEVPLLKDVFLFNSLSLNLGYRRANYSGFGSVDAYKADASWRPFEQLLIRGGYQRSIRAPSLGELFAPTATGSINIGAVPGAGDPCDSRSAFRSGANAAQIQALCIAQGVPAAIYPTFTYINDTAFGSTGGNPNLTPEKADSFTIGTVWSPRFGSPMFRMFNLSVDYYNIKLRDAIGTVALTQILPRCFNFDGLSNPGYSLNNVFCQQITRDTRSGAISFGREGALNLATYKTDGIDVQFDWGFDLAGMGLGEGAGTMRLNSVVTYTRSFKVSSLPGSPVLDYVGSIGNNAVSPQIAHPRWKTNTSLGYTSGAFTITGRWRFIDKMIHQDKVVNPAAITPGVPAYSYFDADFTVNVSDRFQFTGGITNIGNKAPPFVSGQPLTTDSATYDIIGRSFFVGAKVKF
ncbi:TonB-dependent receptor [Sphingomonas sp. CBMAI 2297]|nr:TonB-dependent receptor [Sphingomonas sp. CBMAI 2297]MDH4746204.1 TonB-dependent receptor [Sphingomonas sp. CBMAI 2297]